MYTFHNVYTLKKKINSKKGAIPKMGDVSFTFGLCLGIILLLVVIIVGGSAILDFDPRSTIENNTTVELNGLHVTVPQTTNYTINESSRLYNHNDTDKFGYQNVDEIAEGNAWCYQDDINNVTVYVAYSNRTSYSDIPDFSEMDSVTDGSGKREHIEKRNVGDRVVYVRVVEGKDLSKKIVASATPV